MSYFIATFLSILNLPLGGKKETSSSKRVKNKGLFILLYNPLSLTRRCICSRNIYFIYKICIYTFIYLLCFWNVCRL